MATFSFPTPPSLNQTYTFQGKTWKYNGTGWALVTNVDIAQSAWNTANLAYINSNSSTILAQAAYNSSNTKFSSSGGTITGNTSIYGNLTVTGNISYTGNVTSTTITGNTGQFFGYSSNGFNAIYAGIPSGYLVTPQMITQFTANYNGYAGVNHQNINNGTLSSVDAFFTPNNGSENDTFLDLGMASSTYNYPGYTMITPNDSYLISYGNTNTGGGNMIITTVLNNDIIFTTGGANTENEMARFKDGIGFVLKNKPIKFADSTTQNTAAAPYNYSTSAYDFANSTFTYATAGFNKANAANVLAQSSYDFANTVNTYAFSAYSYANSTNTLTVAGFNKANAANVLAQSSYDFANTVNTYSFSAYSYANATNTLTVSAYNKANAANVLAQSAYDAGNSTNTLTVSSYNKANAANVLAQSAYDSGNNTYTYAQAGYVKANGAVQTAFVTVSANGASITPSSNNDTLTLTAASANGINILNPSSKTIDFGLRSSGVTAGNYGGSSAVPSISVDAFGRITSVSNTSITATATTVANVDTFTGNGSTVAFTLTQTPYNTNSTIVNINGAIQQKSTYSLSGNIVTLTEAPRSGASIEITTLYNAGGSGTITGALISTTDTFTGNGSTTGYTLTVTPSSTNYVFVNIDGVQQQRANYSLVGSTLTFTTAPPNSSKIEITSLTSASGAVIGLNTFGGSNNAVYSSSANTLVAGTLPITAGGTNSTSFTTGQIIYYNGTSLTSLANSGVTAGSYGNTTTIPSITVDAYGRVTSVSNNTVYIPPATSIVANTGQLTANASTGIVALGLATTAVSAGNYGGSTQIPVITVDAYGRITSASNTSVSSTINLSGTTGSGSVSGGGTLTFASNNGITASASGSTITISSPQDLQTSASPRFSNLTANGVTISSGSLTFSGNISAAAWTTSGIRHVSVPATLTDTTSTGTVVNAYTNNFGGNTIAASNAVTYTNYATVYLNNPVAGTNVTITNPYSLITAGNVLVNGTTTATTFSGSGANLTNVPAANVTGTLTSTVLGNSTHYIGTTAIALNRASASQSLTGVSIDGSAATFTSTSQNSQFNSIGVNTAASASAGEIRATGNITAGYSDDKLKNKLGNITNALEKLLTLNGFYFEPNATAIGLGYTPSKQVGVSAQEVQAVLPEVVVPAPIDEKYLTVQYEKIIPLLIEAIKEQQKQIDALTQKVK